MQDWLDGRNVPKPAEGFAVVLAFTPAGKLSADADAQVLSRLLEGYGSADRC